MINKYDITSGTIKGVWRGVDIDRPYEFKTAEGRDLKGKTSTIYLDPEIRGIRTASFQIRVTDEKSIDKLVDLDKLYLGKTVVLEIHFTVGERGIQLNFSSVLQAVKA